MQKKNTGKGHPCWWKLIRNLFLSKKEKACLMLSRDAFECAIVKRDTKITYITNLLIPNASFSSHILHVKSVLVKYHELRNNIHSKQFFCSTLCSADWYNSPLKNSSLQNNLTLSHSPESFVNYWLSLMLICLSILSPRFTLMSRKHSGRYAEGKCYSTQEFIVMKINRLTVCMCSIFR